MAVDEQENRVNRRNTTYFIDQHPMTVPLTRPGKRVADGAGGYTTDPGPEVVPQKMRKIIQGGNVASRNIDGQEITPAFVFIGEWDADIKTGDEFKIDNIEYHVIYVRDDRRYETWAEVAQRG